MRGLRGAGGAWSCGGAAAAAAAGPASYVRRLGIICSRCACAFLYRVARLCLHYAHALFTLVSLERRMPPRLSLILSLVLSLALCACGPLCAYTPPLQLAGLRVRVKESFNIAPMLRSGGGQHSFRLTDVADLSHRIKASPYVRDMVIKERGDLYVFFLSDDAHLGLQYVQDAVRGVLTASAAADFELQEYVAEDAMREFLKLKG